MKKACKTCKILVEKGTCPICKGSVFSDGWKGRVYVFDTEKSEIGKNINLKLKGEYAIKLR